MSRLTWLTKILRLKDREITAFSFPQRDTELHLWVKPCKNGGRCPVCERRCPIVRQAQEVRSWEDVAILGRKVLFWYAPKEIVCPTHGLVQEAIPWAARYARITYRLEFRLCALCQIMTQKAAAAILKMAPSTLSNCLHRVITRVRTGHTIRGSSRSAPMRSRMAKAGNMPRSSTIWTAPVWCGWVRVRGARRSTGSSMSRSPSTRGSRLNGRAAT